MDALHSIHDTWVRIYRAGSGSCKCALAKRDSACPPPRIHTCDAHCHVYLSNGKMLPNPS
eukprot:772631-Pelagomonas_calceolata.AAC.1